MSPSILGKQSPETLQKFVDIIRNQIDRTSDWRAHNFMLNCPEKFSTQKDGKWSSKVFIGENQFVLISAYAGKNGNVNCIFVQEENANTHYANAGIGIAGSVRTIEMTVDAAKEKLDGFGAFLALAWQNHADGITAETQKKVAAMENAAHEEAKINPYETNPLFGSW